MRNLALNLLLVAGTLCATLGFARTDPSHKDWQRTIQVQWPLALAGLAMMGVAVMTRVAIRNMKRSPLDRDLHEGEVVQARQVREWLTEAADSTRQLIEARLPEDTPRIIEHIVHGPLYALFEHRYALASLYGSVVLSRIIAPASEAERWLNRAWSAYVDGYFEPAKEALEIAHDRLQNVLQELPELILPD